MKVEYAQRLLDDMVVVQMLDEKSVVRATDWTVSLRGKVIAHGPGKLLYNGKRTKMSVRKGSIVTFGPTAGMDSMYQGHKIRMMRDPDIDCVVMR